MPGDGDDAVAHPPPRGMRSHRRLGRRSWHGGEPGRRGGKCYVNINASDVPPASVLLPMGKTVPSRNKLQKQTRS
jgi:hypothetical protein